MAITGWDATANRRRKLLCDVDGILRTKPEGVYLVVLPTLDDGEQHRLILTSDGKLLVDDPTTQALILGIPQFTEGLTSQSAGLGRGYADIAAASYAELVAVTAAGYITGIMIQLKLEEDSKTDFIIEVDGSEVGHFTAHASGHGNCNTGNPAECGCFNTNWHADFKYVFMLSPMYRFDTSFKIQVYNNDAADAKSVGSLGSITYLTE